MKHVLKEEDLLSLSYSTTGHPVCKCSAHKRTDYVVGLGSVLWEATGNDRLLRLAFNMWTKKTFDINFSNRELNSLNVSEVKKAIRADRRWWQWWSISSVFFFDCYAFASLIDVKLVDNIHKCLLSQCNYKEKKIEEEVYNAFKSNRISDNELLDSFQRQHYSLNNSFLERPLSKILFVATVSAGKSTLINAICGHNVCKAMNMACTKQVRNVFNNVIDDGEIFAKTEMELVSSSDNIIFESENFESVGAHFNSLLSECRICLIDTPGVNNAKELNHMKITEDAIKNEDYDVAIFVSNACYNGSTDERNVLELLIKNTKRPIIFVLNWLDDSNPKQDSISQMLKNFKNEIEICGLNNSIIIPISAKAAFLAKTIDKHDDEDSFEYSQIYKRFTKDYYNLPAYLGVGNTAKNVLDYSGVPLLERTILNIINKQNTR